MLAAKKNQVNQIKILLQLLLIVLGVFFFPVITGAFALICAFVTNGKKRYWLLCAFCLLSSLVFLDIIPGNGLDVDRYLVVTNQMSMVSGVKDWLSFCLTNPSTQYEKTSYLFFILQYFASRSHYINLLPYISTVLTSFLYFFPFIDYTKSKNIRVKWYAVILSVIPFFMLGYGNIASTMRWGLAVSSCLFMDYIYFNYLKSRKYIFLLLLPLLFHLGIIIAVLLSIYVALVKRLNVITIIFPVLFILLYMNTAVRGNSSTLIGQLSNMTAIYSNGFGEGQIISQGARLVMVVQYVTTVLLSSYYLYLKRKYTFYKYPLNNFNTLLTFILIVFFLNSVIFYRYVAFAAPIYCFSILQILQEKKSDFIEILWLSLIFIGSFFLGAISYRQFAFAFSDVGVIFKSIYSLLLNATT